MRLKTLGLSLFLATLSLGCAKNASESQGFRAEAASSPQGPEKYPVVECDRIFFPELIDQIHSSQPKFRLIGEGNFVRCPAGGQLGYPAIAVLPNLEADPSGEGSPYSISFLLLNPSENEQAELVASLGVRVPEGQRLPVNLSRVTPHFVRFAAGAIFPVSKTEIIRGEAALKVRFELRGERGESALLREKVALFRDGRVPAELLWKNESPGFTRRMVEPGKPGEWNELEGVELLASFLREEGAGLQSRQLRALKLALQWQVEPAALHAALPELYARADQDWQKPRIRAESAADLFAELRYLIQVRYDHPRAGVLEAFDRVNKYSGLFPALTFAWKYDQGEYSWPQEKLPELVSLSESLYERFRGESLEAALSIVERTGFDTEKSYFISRLASGLREVLGHGKEAVGLAFAKAEKGLSEANEEIYLVVARRFVKEAKASSAEAEQAADELVLSGRYSEWNPRTFVSTVAWGRAAFGLSFREAFAEAESLGLLSEESFESARQANVWLRAEVGLTAAEARMHVNRYFKELKLTAEGFARLRAGYAEALAGGLAPREALAKAEACLAGEPISNLRH